MRLFILSSVILLAWNGAVKFTDAGGDTFAAVPGTGWTDISQLQSTCSRPGYFTNPSDCTRFYNCVDHSTPEHTLYLRYDFECPAGTAFDEANKICNYPGPNGCIVSGGGWGWNSPGWNSGWDSGWSKENGWSKDSGIWQSTKAPSWGTPVRQGVVVSSTTAAPFPSNPRLNLPTATRIVHVPNSGWESFRIRNPGTSGVFQRIRVTTEAPEASGWSTTAAPTVVNSGVFQSARVTTQQGPSVTWGSSRVIPVQTGVFQSARVTPVPQTEWEAPLQFPVVTPSVASHTIVDESNGGWSSAGGGGLRVTPSPPPIPANPQVPVRISVIRVPQSTPGPSLEWQKGRITAPPAIAWQSQRITQISQPQPYNPSVVTWQGGRLSTTPAPVEWQAARVTQTQGQQPVRITWGAPQVTSQQINLGQRNGPVAANPALPFPAPPNGWDNVRVTQLPSGYAWQTNNAEQQGNSEISQSQSEATGQTNELEVKPVQEGDFGIVQQVIDENRGQDPNGGAGGKSHIQLIYETKERQQQNANFENQGQSVQILQGPQGQGQGQTQTQVQTINEIQQGAANDPSNKIYEIVPSAESGIKGRIFVLYAPFNKGPGGKRDVPVIEVRVEDVNDDKVESDNNNQNEYNKK